MKKLLSILLLSLSLTANSLVLPGFGIEITGEIVSDNEQWLVEHVDNIDGIPVFRYFSKQSIIAFDIYHEEGAENVLRRGVEPFYGASDPFYEQSKESFDGFLISHYHGAPSLEEAFGELYAPDPVIAPTPIFDEDIVSPHKNIIIEQIIEVEPIKSVPQEPVIPDCIDCNPQLQHTPEHSILQEILGADFGILDPTSGINPFGSQTGPSVNDLYTEVELEDSTELKEGINFEELESFLEKEYGSKRKQKILVDALKSGSPQAYFDRRSTDRWRGLWRSNIL